jgi:hypothetical protein
MNAIPPMRPDQPVTITLPALAWNSVLEGLTFLPWRVANPLIAQIHEQVERAPLDAVLAATENASTARDAPQGSEGPVQPSDAQ